MTREEAQKLVQDYMLTLKQPSEGLNPQGFGGAVVGDAQLYFEYHGKTQQLEASALVYRFRDRPKAGVIDGFKEEEKAGTNTGGGVVDYEPENKSLFLSRSYAEVPPVAAFQEHMKQLMEASREWGASVLERVASRVFNN